MVSIKDHEMRTFKTPFFDARVFCSNPSVQLVQMNATLNGSQCALGVLYCLVPVHVIVAILRHQRNSSMDIAAMDVSHIIALLLSHKGKSIVLCVPIIHGVCVLILSCLISAFSCNCHCTGSDIGSLCLFFILSNHHLFVVNISFFPS